MMDTDTKRPLAVVTGASSGIGYHLARQFAENGYDLIIAAEDSGLADVQADLIQMGIHAERLQVDLATYEGVEQLYAKIKADPRPLAAIAINAGMGVHGDFARETDLEDEIKMIQLNIIGSVHLAKRVSRDMVVSGAGRILITSSIAAVMPSPYLAVYGATKAFLYSFAEALGAEMKEAGVSVTALLPGPTDTNFYARAGMEDTKLAQGKMDDPAEVARQGFKALMEGRDQVLAESLRTKMMGVMAEVMPETLKAAQHARRARPGSGRPGSDRSDSAALH